MRCPRASREKAVNWPVMERHDTGFRSNLAPLQSGSRPVVDERAAYIDEIGLDGAANAWPGPREGRRLKRLGDRAHAHIVGGPVAEAIAVRDRSYGHDIHAASRFAQAIVRFQEIAGIVCHRLISSYLGETATNIRKIFEFARKQPTVLFFDEFDALAREREDGGEHNELRRVVNSLLIFIDRIQPKGFLVAATNLDQSLDAAIWRRFDEVVWFDPPEARMTARFLKMKFRNVALAFDPQGHVDALTGYSYAELDRICVQAIKASVIDKRKQVREQDFLHAIADERRRRRRTERMTA